MLCLGNASFAQTDGSDDQCVKKGKFIIDAYYGYPYLLGSVLNAVDKDLNSVTNNSISNTNHIGSKMEFMVSDKIGLGIDYTFAKVSATFNDTVDGIKGEYHSSLSKNRALVRMNVHFGTTKRLDPYSSFGIGFKKTTFKTDNPNTGYADKIDLTLIPVSVRIGIGLHIFVSRFVGFNVEMGIGGPIIQAGISSKFP